MKISVIIPTLNRTNSLMETLESYDKYLNKLDEIIIVDQSKKSLDKELKNKFKNLNLNYIHYPYPSLTKARNVGISNTKNEIIIFSDDDIRLEYNTIDNIREKFNNPKISMIGAIDLNLKLKEFSIRTIGSIVIGRKSLLKVYKGHMTNSILGNFPVNSIKKEEFNTEWAMGFFFCCRKENINKWNLQFDENLVSYAYAEDLDFSHRYYLKSMAENLQTIMSKKIGVYHMCSQEYRIPKYKGILMYVLHREYLFYKFQKGFKDRIIFEWSDLLFFLRKIIKREKPLDFIKAKFISKKYRNELKKGIIPDSLKELLI